jgi:NTP pyrophosphatase (non-canonical NTP hydrolase)
MSDFNMGSSNWPGLSKLVEEAGEVLQVAGKLMAMGGAVDHWDGQNLKKEIVDELADLLAAIDFFVHVNELDERAISIRKNEKYGRFLGWHVEHGGLLPE